MTRSKEEGGPTATLRLKVELVETLGYEVMVHGRLGETPLVAKMDPHNRPEIDDEVDMVVELNRMHLFDVASERRLSEGD